jgi:hypothetical protein
MKLLLVHGKERQSIKHICAYSALRILCRPVALICIITIIPSPALGQLKLFVAFVLEFVITRLLY